ncbi:MAG: hypothetical protein FJY11_04850 [Bacteroidetes bacterium]|nr:hypothetical protein [Bacteroidota bacterium]
MSILQTLRERAGWLVAVVIGIALLIFVISDFFGSGSGQQRQARKFYELATIGNESLSYQEYDARLQNLIEIYKLSGTPNITEELAETLRAQIWEQIVREKILQKEFVKLGIEVSDEELAELVTGNQKHPIVIQLFTDRETGMFNESFLINFLKQTESDPTALTYWLFFEDEIVTERLNAKYNNMVSKGLHVTKFQAEFEKSSAARSVDFTYAGRYFATIPDSLVTISQDEIRKHYASRKEEYKRPALRSMEYVTFDIEPSQEDIDEAFRWISNYIDEFAGSPDPEQFVNLTADTRHVGFYLTAGQLPETLREFARKGEMNVVFGPYLEDKTYRIARIIDIAERPDSVRARHILIAAGPEKTMAMAKLEADSLLNVIRGGMSFDLVAMLTSDDQGSAQVGGDLGWFPEGMMVIPFNNACFSGKKGDLVIAETTYGVHIIEIIEQSSRVRKYNIGIIDREVIPGSATIQKIYGEASQFAGNNPTHEKFNLTVAELGLNKKIATDITQDQKDIAGLEGARYLIMSLFETVAGKIVLDNSQQAVFELGNQYVVAYCTRSQEEGIAGLSDVEDEIRYKLINLKKAELAANELSMAMNEGKTLEVIAREKNLLLEEAAAISFRSFSVQGMAGIEPALIAAASAAGEGILTGPVKGNNGAYLLTVNSSAPANEEELQMIIDRLSAMLQIRSSYELFEALRKEAGIVDKRHKFF